MLQQNHIRKYNTVFHSVINGVLIERKISFEQLSKLIREVILDRETELTQFIPNRNHLVACINGYRKITYPTFKFLMEDVLKEPIPDDPEIAHLKNLGLATDLRGQKLGRWTVGSCFGVGDKYQNIYWNCTCDCGNERTVNRGSLTSGKSVSCGCYMQERRNEAIVTHGKTKSREYKSWDHMIQRCTNPNYKHFNNYGGRGITVDPRWRKFENFYEDMGDRPEGMSLDRKDNDGDYCKENCRWATRKEQQNNRRNTLRFDGAIPVATWAESNGVNYEKAKYDYHFGRTQDDILKSKR